MTETPIQQPISEASEQDINARYLEAGTAISSRIAIDGRQAYLDNTFEGLKEEDKAAIQGLVDTVFPVHEAEPPQPLAVAVKEGLTAGLDLAQRMLGADDLDRMERTLRTNLGQIAHSDNLVSHLRTAVESSAGIKSVLPANLFESYSGGLPQLVETQNEIYANALVYVAMHADNQLAEAAIKEVSQLPITEELTMVAEDAEHRAKLDAASQNQ